MCFVFFFKQKTAYEMRISDWSSDVCSSDLILEHRLRVAVAGIAGRGHRRQADAGAAGTDLLYHGGGDLQHQAGAVFDAAAIGVGTLVDAAAQELVEQVAVGTMDLDAVEAGGDGIGRALAIGLDNTGQFAELERSEEHTSA